MPTKSLRLGLTKEQIVNARGGLHHLNDFDVQEEIEMQRDATTSPAESRSINSTADTSAVARSRAWLWVGIGRNR